MAIKVKWEGNVKLVAENDKGNKVAMEPGAKHGGTGQYPTPLELVAMAHGGCTGIDIILLMKKMRVELETLEIDVETKRRTEPPEYYEEIKLTYVMSGKGLTEENAMRAAQLSNEKYCSVGAMLGAKAKISYAVKVV